MRKRQQDKTGAQAQYKQGRQHAREGNDASAIQAYDQAIELNPKFADAHYHRGLAHARLRDYGRATKDLKRAVKLKPDMAWAYYDAGRVYALMGKSKDACKWLKKAIGRHPRYKKQAWSDVDFASLRKDKGFRKLLGVDEWYAIIPGASIGPFALGMTRHEIDEVRSLERKRGVRVPLEDASQEGKKQGSPSPGVYVYYDATGKCCKLEAIFGYRPLPPIFTLLGHVVNGMTSQEAARILRSIGAGVESFYASLSSPAGVQTTKWEASDEHIMSVVVTPGTKPPSERKERPEPQEKGG